MHVFNVVILETNATHRLWRRRTKPRAVNFRSLVFIDRGLESRTVRTTLEAFEFTAQTIDAMLHLNHIFLNFAHVCSANAAHVP